MTKKNCAAMKNGTSRSSEERAAASERGLRPGADSAAAARRFSRCPMSRSAALARWSRREAYRRAAGRGSRDTVYDYARELCRAHRASPRNGRRLRNIVRSGGSTSSSFREWLYRRRSAWAAAADIMTNICRSPVSGVLKAGVCYVSVVELPVELRRFYGLRCHQ